MSSPRVATAVRPTRRPTSPKADRTDKHSLSADAKRLATALDRMLAQGRLDALSPDALQGVMAALCKLYTAQVEAGQDVLPLGRRSAATPTEVMTTASGLLRAVNLAVFELGMWQSWTGR